MDLLRFSQYNRISQMVDVTTHATARGGELTDDNIGWKDAKGLGGNLSTEMTILRK
jgi:hypothetical protein